MLKRAPLLWFSACFSCGILINHYLPLYILILFVLLSTSIVILGSHYFRTNQPSSAPPSDTALSVTPRKNRIGLILILLGLLLSMLGGLRQQEVSDRLNHPPKLLTQKIYAAEFKILAAPDEFLAGNKQGFWQTQAQIIRLNGTTPDPDTRVILRGKGDCRLLYADTVSANHILEIPPKGSRFPGDFSYADFLQSKGLSTTLKILGDYSITHPDTLSLRRRLELFRAHAIETTLKYSTASTSGFLAATIFGFRENLTDSLLNSFRSTGIGHILAISGLHVGLIILIANFICLRLRLSPRCRALITILVCIIFLFLSGGRSAVLRASIIAFIYLGGILIFRKSNFLNSLGTAALLILLLNPLQLFDLGFQLSFISVLFISILSQAYLPYMQALLPAHSPHTKGWQYALRALPYSLASLLIVTLSAWLGVFPLSAFCFSEVSLISLLSNLLIIPLMPLAISGGLLLQFCPLLPAAITPLYATLCSLPAESILQINNTLTALPLTSLDLFPPRILPIVIYYLLFLLIFLLLPNRLKPAVHLRHGSYFLLLLTLSYIIYSGRSESKPEQPSIALLRNRYGEAVIIRGQSSEPSATGETVLHPYNILLLPAKAYPAALIDYLFSEHIHRIDYLILSRTDIAVPSKLQQKLAIQETIWLNTKRGATDINLTPVPAVQINITRSKSGSNKWYNICNHSLDILLTNWQSQKQHTEFTSHKKPGYDSEYKILRITGNSPLISPTPTPIRLQLRDKTIANHPGRQEYGIIIITPDSVKAWNGKKYINLYEYEPESN